MEPKPSVITVTTSAGAIFVARAVRKLTSTRATKAWTLKRMMSRSSSATAAAAMASRGPEP